MKIVISARRIRAMREELECTQEQFGALIGRSRSTVARWESRGGIKGRVPATGKKAESVRTLKNLEKMIVEMVVEKVKLEQKRAFLVQEKDVLCDLAPITVARLAGNNDAMAKVSYLIRNLANSTKS